MSIQFDWHDAEDERWDRDEHDHRAAKHDWRPPDAQEPVSYTHLRAHETVLDIVCRLLLEKKKNTTQTHNNK